MATKTEQFNKSQLKQLPDIKSGDIVKVHQKITESFGKSRDKGDKERIQIFEGLVIAKKHGSELRNSGIFRKSWETWKNLFPTKGQATLSAF